MKISRCLVLAVTCAVTAVAASADTPPGYPATYADIIAKAKGEGKVVVYGGTGIQWVQPLFNEFMAMYPGVSVEYSDLGTSATYDRLISETAAKSPSADISWNLAANLHAKLAVEGYALEYASPELPNFDAHKVWENKLYTMQHHPVCHAYNTELLDKALVPKTHNDIPRLLSENVGVFSKKVSAYNIESSGVGFMQMEWESKADPTFWDLVKALGRVGASFYPSTAPIIERIGSGELLFAYNMPCATVTLAAAKNKRIGILFMEDRIQVLSQPLFINKSAVHPNAAKLFLNYMLSEKGQRKLANLPGYYAARNGIIGPGFDVARYSRVFDVQKFDDAGVQGLLSTLRPENRLKFLAKWKQTLRAGASQ